MKSQKILEKRVENNLLRMMVAKLPLQFGEMILVVILLIKRNPENIQVINFQERVGKTTTGKIWIPPLIMTKKLTE